MASQRTVELAGSDYRRLLCSFLDIGLMEGFHLGQSFILFIQFGDNAIEDAALIQLDSRRTYKQGL